MNRAITDLRKRYNRKICAIEKFLALASVEDLFSEVRKEILAQVAVELRSLFCYSGGESLIVKAQMETTMFFPLHDPMSPFNELSQFLLVGCNYSSKQCTFFSSVELNGKIAKNWLSFYSWVNEVVVDIKADGYPPLSRLDVIKIIADKEGAHVDEGIHPFIELIESTNVMPIRFFIGDSECQGDCSNLLYETIYSIATEAVYSYKHVRNPIFLSRKNSSSAILGIFTYEIEKKKKFKYTICGPGVNLYNNNKSYPCIISKNRLESSDMLFCGRSYLVNIIRVESMNSDQNNSSQNRFI